MRKFLLAFVIAVACLFGVSNAQERISGKDVYTEDGYTIQKGDTLWYLEGIQRGDPTQWRRLVSLNPFLEKPGRIFDKNGKTIALIKPGEKLYGLEEMGILPRALPLSALKEAGSMENWSVFWFLVALVLAVGILVLLFYRAFEWVRRRNPVTSGEPVVPGGIAPSDSARVRSHFDTIANRRFASSVPNTPRPIRIGPIESGFLSGNGVVRYRDGSEQHHRLNRQTAFRARFRLPNGTEEVLYFLQGCANDVVFHDYVGFNWEAGEEIVPAPIPVPAQQDRVAPLRAVSETGVMSAHYMINDIEITAPAGTELRVNGQNLSLIITPGGGEVTLRKVERSKKSPKKAPATVATK
ncbi:MAG: LysM peptidoglycan-binding domain-containing protein [bacterium]|nr:LysM peptidoglycan-binding domain-containing protein [bacterium]